MVLDRQRKVLGHLVLIDHAAHAQGDVGAPGEFAAINPGLDLGQTGVRRAEQFLALVRAKLRQFGIAAGDQPFAGKLRCAEFEQVALIE